MAKNSGPQPLKDLVLFSSKINGTMVVVAPQVAADRIMEAVKDVEPEKISDKVNYLIKFYEPMLKNVDMLEIIIKAVHAKMVEEVKADPGADLFKTRLNYLYALQERINILCFFLDHPQLGPALLLMKGSPTYYYDLLLPLMKYMGLYYASAKAMYKENIIPADYYLPLYKQILYNYENIRLFLETQFEFFSKNLLTQDSMAIEIVNRIGFKSLWGSYYDLVAMLSDYAYLVYIHGETDVPSKLILSAKELIVIATTNLAQLPPEKKLAIGFTSDFPARLMSLTLFEPTSDLPTKMVDPVGAMLDHLFLAHSIAVFCRDYKSFIEQHQPRDLKKNNNLTTLADKLLTDSKQISPFCKAMLKLRPQVHLEDAHKILSNIMILITQVRGNLAQIDNPWAVNFSNLLAKMAQGCHEHHTWISALLAQQSPPPKPVAKETVPQPLGYKQLKKLDEQRRRQEIKASKKAERIASIPSSGGAVAEVGGIVSRTEIAPSTSELRRIETSDPVARQVPVKVAPLLTIPLPPVKDFLAEEDELLASIEKDANEEVQSFSKAQKNKEKRKLKKEKKEKEQASKAEAAALKAEEERKLEERVLRHPFAEAKKYQVPGVQIQVDPKVRVILDAIKKEGYIATIAGGNVRDQLKGKKPNDVDILTDYPKEKLNEKLCEILGERAKPNPEHPNRFHLNGIDIVCPGKEDKFDSDASAFENLLNRLRDYDISINTFCADEDGNVYDFLGFFNHLDSPFLFMLNEDVDARFKQKPGEICRLIRFSHQFDKAILPRHILDIKENAHLVPTLPWLEYQKHIMDLFLKGVAEKNLEFLIRHELIGKLIPPLQALTLNATLKKWYLEKAAELDAMASDERTAALPLHHIFAFLLAPVVHELQEFYPTIDHTIKSVCCDFAQCFGGKALPSQDFLEEKIREFHTELLLLYAKDTQPETVKKTVHAQGCEVPVPFLTAYPLHMVERGAIQQSTPQWQKGTSSKYYSRRQ